MAKGFKHGTSGKKENSLNFAVVAYPSEVELNTATPEDTTITTIGVVTTNPINGWYFISEQPKDMKEGEVWISTGTSSAVEFNALKKNNVTVYPMSAKQMVSGALKDVTAKSYQNGKWVDWYNGELFEDGNQYTDITGGWSDSGYVYYGTSYEKVSPVIGDTIILKANSTTSSGNSTCSIAGIQKAIDVTDKSKVSVDVISYSGAVYICVTDSTKNTHPSKTIASTSISKTGTTELDISEVTGNVYIAVATAHSSTQATNQVELNKVRLA